jgi:hypothetical protein
MLLAAMLSARLTVSSQSQVLTDFAPLGAKSARPVRISFERPSPFHNEDQLGDSISLDGSLLFKGLGELYDLKNDKSLWEERMWWSEVKGQPEYVVGTGSQAHYWLSEKRDRAYLMDAVDMNTWLTTCPSKNKGRTQLAIVDTKSRKIPPNKQLLMVPPDRVPKGVYVLLSSSFLDSKTVRVSTRFRDEKKKAYVICYSDIVIANPKFGPYKYTEIRPEAGMYKEWRLADYDRKVGYALYGREVKATGQYECTEVDLVSGKRQKLTVPDYPKIHTRATYWRNNLLVYRPREIQNHLKEHVIYRLSRSTGEVVKVGDYRWFASSSDQRWALVKDCKAETFWLLDFGSSYR